MNNGFEKAPDSFGLGRESFSACNNAIIVTGSARSGTTILGKLLHSFEGVEYAFEPPTLYSLFALMKQLTPEQWQLMYETYLYEEFFINALAGRSLNCNRKDDSSIYNVKNAADIETRLTNSMSKNEVETLRRDSRIAYKMPDIVGYLPQLKGWYPDSTIVVITRKAPEVFQSLLRKAWFNDKNLQFKNEIWPCYRIGDKKVPFWVEVKDAERWSQMDELHRIAYYYLIISKLALAIKDKVTIKYDELVSTPQSVVANLAEELGLCWGEKTESITASVIRQTRVVDQGILAGLQPRVRAEVLLWSEAS